MASLADADPISEVLAWLQAHPTVLAELGGADHVSGSNEPPYPHVRVTDSAGGDDGDLTWLISPEVVVETYGDPDGGPGWAELRRLHYVVLLAALEIRTRDHDVLTTVITSIVPASSANASPLPLGQPRYVSTLRLSMHPAIA